VWVFDRTCLGHRKLQDHPPFNVSRPCPPWVDRRDPDERHIVTIRGTRGDPEPGADVEVETPSGNGYVLQSPDHLPPDICTLVDRRLRRIRRRSLGISEAFWFGPLSLQYFLTFHLDEIDDTTICGIRHGALTRCDQRLHEAKSEIRELTERISHVLFRENSATASFAGGLTQKKISSPYAVSLA
jgi:hypothetical protein